MSKRIIFVDLDRTLFNTPYFMQELWKAIGIAYNIDHKEAFADINNWYQMVGELGYYRINDHIKNVAGVTAQQAIATVSPVLAKQNFMYKDSTEPLIWQKQYSVRILTFGEEWFQRLKLSYMPQLCSLPCDAVTIDKGDYIKQHHSGTQGYLIDDKRNPALPKNVSEIWLNRLSSIPILKEGGIITINSLKQATKLL